MAFACIPFQDARLSFFEGAFVSSMAALKASGKAGLGGNMFYCLWNPKGEGFLEIPIFCFSREAIQSMGDKRGNSLRKP